MIGLAAADWIVMALYGAAVLAIGWAANRRQSDSEDYFLAGRRLPFWVVGVSLIATSFSSVSLIGGTGWGYAVGINWLQWQIGDLIALVVVGAFFLPFFARRPITTAYEYLEHRFGVAARTVASALFVGQTLLRASVLIYSPALALATVLGWSVETAIVVAAAAAILYSAFGGIGAVVWTDLIQMCVIVFAVGYCFFLIAGDVEGGLGALLDHARANGKLEPVQFSARMDTPFNLLGALVPYAVLATSLFGTGQQAVQRFLSCRDLKSARRAALLGWFVGSLSLGLTLLLGTCIAAWSDLGGIDLAIGKGDKVLPVFIGARLPAGLAGLMLAAIFAASMSSLDSAVHSISTATIVDFVRRFSKRPPDSRRELKTARMCTVLVGIAAIAGALAAAQAETRILETLVKWLGYFAGPLLGMFLLGMFTRRATEAGALAGVGVAFAGVVASVALDGPKAWGIHGIWLAPFSCVLTVAVGLVVSLFAGRACPDRPGAA
ncbi:MAG: sodium:solute symporter family transporter [Planctomycetota bacterium]